MKTKKLSIHTQLSALCLASIILWGCITFQSANGKRHIQLFPTHIQQSKWVLDSSKYQLQNFELANYKNKKSYNNGKKIFETITSADVVNMKGDGGNYCIMFWRPECPASQKNIRIADSLLRYGHNVMLLSLTNNYELIDKRLKKYTLHNYPYYIIDNKYASNTLLKVNINFIKECCPECYRKYRDEVVVANYLLIHDGTIEAIMKDDKRNIFYK